jgi:4-methylaminobutanoate oxidase (formaldehyde-forming)
VGGYIRTPEVCWPDGDAAPLATPRTLFDPDLAKFDESWAAARRRVPALRTVDIGKVVHGPEAFTPTASSCSARPRCAASGWRPGFCVHGLRGRAASAR